MSGSNALPSATNDRLGTTIDKRYRIEALLGRGGMGSVYRAEHVTLRRPVAIKLLHPHLGGPEIAKRFEREAFAAGRLVHPNCVQISDFGQLEDGTLYLAMELLEGVSIAEVLERDRRVPPGRALHIVRHVLRGLAHAHERDIVHRDIKPENVILVSQDDDPDFAKVLDFGIAKLLGDAEAEAGGRITRAGVAFGTPMYMSPEQAWGQPVDRRSDLYAVTIMLFEMVAGRAPFVAEESVQILTMHATRPPPRLAEVAPDVPLPPGLEELVARGLEKERDRRFADASAYLRELEPVLARVRGQGAPAAPPVVTPAGFEAALPPGRADGQLGYSATTPLPLPALEGPNPSLPGAPRATLPPGMTTGVHAHPAIDPVSGFHAAAPPRRNVGRILAIAGGALLLLIVFAALASTTGESSDSRFDAAISELENGKQCEERRKAVATLRSLRDPRAIPALEKARYRMRGGVAGIGSKNTNACLRKDAEAAIEYLRRR